VFQGIERSSPVPYYEQLFQILRERITAGAIATDERLPSENELCRKFGLSRATVRQTLSKLETEGYARRVARRGVFASAPGEPSGWTVQDPRGFLDSQVGYTNSGITTEIVDANYVAAPQHVADALAMRSDARRVFALERLRSLDGAIALFSTNWFPPETAATIAGAQDVLQGTGSVTNTLRNAGFVTSGARRVLRAMRAPESVAALLRIEPDQPVMRIRSLSWGENGMRIDYYETWVLTDVVPLEVNVVAH
jgi:GntR family transcriptional regulator